MLKKSAYWLTTTIIALELAVGGVLDMTHAPAVASVMQHLGYPAYFVNILGWWKVLGAVAVIAPGLPRLKEWAYAGTFFELSGAAASHLAAHDRFTNLLVPLGLLMLTVVSWATRPDSRTLGALWNRPGTSPPNVAPPESAAQSVEPDLRGLGS
jgi:uncharacterized membrane protein YphA (DoxX/SURF4 family)